MANPLKDYLISCIRAEGPITVAQYMRICLGHPEYGYYATRDPFGVEGDFITAPEISQMFGEMIGAWIADSWIKMGAPNPFYLVEFGPGRGTLMHDILRATKNVDNFHQAMSVYLVETSPFLRQKQQDVLKSWCGSVKNQGVQVHWCTDIKMLPSDAPVLFIGNEFLDALAVHQYSYTEAGWVENFIDINEYGSFRIVKKSAKKDQIEEFPSLMFPPKIGEQLEVSFEQIEFINNLINIMKKQRSIALFIDYGYTMPLYGSTLQAMMEHQYRNILDCPGECDLTAHVNFAHLSEFVLRHNMTLYGPVSQKDFLIRLGIEVRASQLKNNASGQQVQDIQSSLTRLTGSDTRNNQMGDLFKVMAFTANPNLNLEGFS